MSHPCRYLAGGALCAGLHNAVLIGADLVRIHYIVGMVISMIVVTPVGYLHQSILTFGRPPSWPRFAVFAAGTLSGFPLSLSLMLLFCSGLGLPVFVATPLATVSLLVWNYLWARRAILHASPSATS
ncbi:GtrA family protein [Novosphingobium sp. 9U]|uniref:GtrA family protein n=1 Tax=Novosphingobium sp. 9U TaxID=2653158 RepID=UPI00135A27B7|nr:GtrA family protein [Novosphingobium sp. 9U]